MLDFDTLYQKVKETLSEKRFYHSVCVMNKCEELAEFYGENKEKAKLAGLLHDIAKEVPKEKRIEMAKKYAIELDEIEMESTGLIHAKLGAKICEVDLEIEQEICTAICYHTTARENMTLLEKILFIGDAIGDDRTYDNTEELKKLAFTNIDEAVKVLLQYTIEDRIKEEKTIHINSIKALNYLIMNKK